MIDRTYAPLPRTRCTCAVDTNDFMPPLPETTETQAHQSYVWF